MYAKRPFGGPENVYEYLGRYTHRVAISNQKLLRLDGEGVTFFTKEGKTLTLEPAEFVRRFLLHILPRRFTKIRHYGLLAPSCVKTRLPLARQRIEEAGLAAPLPEEKDDADLEQLGEDPLCPKCGKGRLSIRRPLPDDPVQGPETSDTS